MEDIITKAARENLGRTPTPEERAIFKARLFGHMYGQVGPALKLPDIGKVDISLRTGEQTETATKLVKTFLFQEEFNKEQVKRIMRKGYMVTHRSFTDGEWITYYKGGVRTEEGYSHDEFTFWQFRTNPLFNSGWTIKFKKQYDPKDYGHKE